MVPAEIRRQLESVTALANVIGAIGSSVSNSPGVEDLRLSQRWLERVLTTGT
jgi:hypothetical protein